MSTRPSSLCTHERPVSQTLDFALHGVHNYSVFWNKNRGLYVQDRMTLSGRVHVLLGGRYDWANTARGNGASISAASNAWQRAVLNVVRFVSVVAGSILVVASSGRAQLRASAGGIAGVVLNASGGRVEDAEVSVVPADGAVCARDRTSDGGRFAIRVMPGQYRVDVDKRGYVTASATLHVVEGAPSEMLTSHLQGSTIPGRMLAAAETTREGDEHD